MEARFLRGALVATLLMVSMGAKHRTKNFVVDTPDPQLAQQMGEAAERYRHDLAIDWLGQALPNWSQPCPMTVKVGPNLGAGGATTFVFDHGEVFGWRMNIQGSRERLLDSVLPHEVTHMIFATHFREPVPRWADEGGATSVEHQSERNKHRKMLVDFLRTNRGIAFNRMFALRDYPPDVMPLYAQGHSLAEYLISVGGRRKYIEFLGDGMRSDNWTAAVQRHYGPNTLGDLQNVWLAWVREGSPAIRPQPSSPAPAGPQEFAAANAPRPSVYSGARAPGPAANPRRVAADPPVMANPAPVRQRPDRGVSWPGPDASVEPFAPATNDQPLASVQGAARSMGWRAAEKSPSRDIDPRFVPPVAPPSAVAPPSGVPATEVARPQPFEQPRQVILEWSKP